MKTKVLNSRAVNASCAVNAPVICNHGPHLRGRVGDSQAKVWGSYFFIERGRAKSIVLTSSLSSRGGVYSRALITEKS